MKKFMTGLLVGSVLMLGLSIGIKANASYIPVNKIQKVETTDTGALLTYKDGTGYYVEGDLNELKANEHYINMNDIVNIETSETGALLTYTDGTGYYWEGETENTSENVSETINNDVINLDNITNIEENDDMYTITVKVNDNYHDYMWEK